MTSSRVAMRRFGDMVTLKLNGKNIFERHSYVDQFREVNMANNLVPKLGRKIKQLREEGAGKKAMTLCPLLRLHCPSCASASDLAAMEA
ncbi:unnamed protein product [Heligmosomoides polygyrus]|uniref:Transposase n=1 Tax=Heligmosomoides polygyrus TaxID=6339 RepID=A0A183FJS3_HELPZ|nr:unnamed protein product [Heligmosomoides polygyrus]